VIQDASAAPAANVGAEPPAIYKLIFLPTTALQLPSRYGTCPTGTPQPQAPSGLGFNFGSATFAIRVGDLRQAEGNFPSGGRERAGLDAV